MDKELDVLLSQFFHSLTNTIGATSNLFNLLDLGAINHSQTKEFLTKISGNINYTNSMIQNIVTWFYLVNNKLFIDFQDIDIGRIISIILENLNDYTYKKNIKINCNLKSFSKINSDENLLYIILYNIIHNSIKFSKKNSTVIIRSSKNHNKKSLHIIDNGIGIDNYLLDKLFKVEFIKEIKRPGTSGESGMGLSLFISKKLLQSLNSNIIIDSKENKGTEVIIEFSK